MSRSRPGHRAPHFWIDERRSVTDLFGDGYVLLAGRDGSAWVAAGADLASQFHIRLRTYVVGGDAQRNLSDRRDRWGQLYCDSPAGAVLIRPDGQVAWRGRCLSNDPVAKLRQALRSVLALKENATDQIA